MKPLLALLLALLIPAIAPADSPTNKPSNAPPISQQVRDVYRLWADAFEKRDLDGMMSHYDRAMHFSMQGQPDQNFEQVRASFVQDFAARDKGDAWRFNIEKVYATENQATVIGIWEYLLKGRSGKRETSLRIRSVDVLQRRDGRLKIVHTVNYPIASDTP